MQFSMLKDRPNWRSPCGRNFKEEPMNYRKSLVVIGAACIGAGIMYVADPKMGKRRLSLVRDQWVSANSKLRRTVNGRTQDLKNRLYGVYCETKSFFGD